MAWGWSINRGVIVTRNEWLQHVYNLLCPSCIRQYIGTLGFEEMFMCVHGVLEYVTWEWKNSMPKLVLPLAFDFQYMCKN
jgi:hypothetical protein